MQETSVGELKQSYENIQRDGCPKRSIALWNGCWSGISLLHAGLPVHYLIDGSRLCVREGTTEVWYTVS